MRKNDIRGGTREWSKNLWEHIKALFSGLDTRVTALEQGGGGGGAVSGVKGDAESTYRTGNVNLTAANIGAKATQSAVSDPTASGTGLTFIDSITQDAQGVITPTKKTVQTATQSADGIMSSTDKVKLDGIAAGAEVNTITGVKGDAESIYRTGNVNITPANVGAVATDLTRIDDCDDNTLSGNGGQIHFYKTNENTLNTPYKQGLTNSTEGLLVVLGNANWTTQIHYLVANTKYYIRSKSGDGSSWNGKEWTINVLKPDMVGEEIPLLSNPLAINNNSAGLQYTANTGNTLGSYKFVDLYFVIQGGYTNAIRLCPEYGNKTYKFGFFAWNLGDDVLRKVAVTFSTAGRYFTNCVVRVAVGDNAAFNAADNALYLYKAIGYKW